MAQSQLALYNMALSEAGAAYTLAATNENNIPCNACNLHFESVRQVILRAAHWTTAKRFARLVEEVERDQSADWVSTDPEPGYAFSYALPSNILAPRFLTDFSPFSISYDDDKRTLNCNVGGSATTDAPILCYTVDVTDPAGWEPDLYQAVMYGLAAAISMPLNAKVQRTRGLFDLANTILLEARANSANDQQKIYEKQADSLAARGHLGISNRGYIYPYGNLLTMTGAPLA